MVLTTKEEAVGVFLMSARKVNTLNAAEHSRSERSRVPLCSTSASTGQPQWHSGLAPPACSQGCDPGDLGSSPTSGSPCGACFSLCLCLCLPLSVSQYINKILKKNKIKSPMIYHREITPVNI